LWIGNIITNPGRINSPNKIKPKVLLRRAGKPATICIPEYTAHILLLARLYEGISVIISGGMLTPVKKGNGLRILESNKTLTPYINPTTHNVIALVKSITTSQYIQII